MLLVILQQYIRCVLRASLAEANKIATEYVQIFTLTTHFFHTHFNRLSIFFKYYFLLERVWKKEERGWVKEREWVQIKKIKKKKKVYSMNSE